MKYVYQIPNIDPDVAPFKVFETDDLEKVQAEVMDAARRYIDAIPTISKKRLEYIAKHPDFESNVPVDDLLTEALRHVESDFDVRVGDYVIKAVDFVQTQYNLGEGFTYKIDWPVLWTLDEWFEIIASTCKS